MKTLFKIILIVAMAALIGSFFYETVTAISSGAGQISVSSRPADGQFPSDGNFAPPDHDNETGGFQFPVESIKNLAIVSVVGAIYLNAGKLFGKKKVQLTVRP